MAGKQRAPQRFPEGIEGRHADKKAWHRYVNPAAVGGIALFLALALGGLFGGQPHPTRVIETPAAVLTLQFPETLRNGELFEMRATVLAKRPIGDLQLGISSSYWRDLTINTMVPAPTEEKSVNGQYWFAYGAMKAGDTLTVKIDGQINPPLFAGTQGDLTLSDGDAALATVPLQLRVFP